MKNWQQLAVRSLIVPLLASVVTLCGCAGESTDRPRNVIFIVTDTLRHDYLSIQGGPASTPNLDNLALMGIRFARAYSHVPVTGPSHTSMFTGLLPSEHGVHLNTQPLPSEHVTLAEILRDHGYNTAAFISLGVLQSKFGFDQGFDHFDEDFGADYFRRGDEITDRVLQWLAGKPREPYFLWVHYSDPHEPYSPPTETFPEIDVWLNSRYLQSISANGYREIIELELQSGENSLLFAPPRGEGESKKALAFRYVRLWGQEVSLASQGGWLIDREPSNDKTYPLEGTHTLPAGLTITNLRKRPTRAKLSLLCHEQYSPAVARRLYAEETVYLDHQIGRLKHALETRDGMRRSIVILTSDHGEGLGEHGLMGHIQQLYESLLRVPLLMVAPGLIPKGESLDIPVRHIDLLPTVLELLEINPPVTLAGSSLLPLISRRFSSDSLPVIASTHRPLAKFDLRSLTRFPYKYILNLQTSEEELYDILQDPRELTNIIYQKPGVAAELKLTLERETERGEPSTKATEDAPALSQEEIDKLQALGYVD